jgi:NADH-quinone oxidoreductase subunit L
LAGFIGIPEVLGGHNLIADWLSNWHLGSLHVTHKTELILMGGNILAAFIGIFIAYKKFYMYNMKNIVEPTGIVWNKFYIDEIYDRFFVKKAKALSVFISYKIDVNIIDKIVMGLSYSFIKSGHVVARMQNANTRFYAFIMLLGISVISTYLIMVMR